MQRSRPPDTSTLGSSKSGILYDDQGSTQPTAGVVGTRAGRNQLPNLLPSRITEWKAGHVINLRHSEYRPEKGRVENHLVTTVLREKHLTEGQTRSFVTSSARLASLPIRNWNGEFLQKVRKAAQEDPAYQKAWEEVEQEAALPEEQRMDRKARSIMEIQEELLY